MPRGTDRLDEARLQQRLWTPALWSKSFVNCWLDFSDTRCITGNASSQITAAADISGNGYSLSGTVSYSGSAFPSAVGGVVGPQRRRGLTPDGTQYLQFASDIPYPGGTTGWSMMCVVEKGDKSIACAKAGVVGPDFYFVSNTIQLDRSGVINLVKTGTLSNAPMVCGWSASTNYAEIWVNGASAGSTSTDPGFTGGQGRIFTNSVANYTYLGGAAGEFIWTNKLSTRERNTLEGYLAWKWGIPFVLSASHPYKNRPPLIGV